MKLLQNVNENSKKIIVCFSGLSGSGKTTFAKHIEENYGAVRISSDEIRSLVSSLGFAKDYSESHNVGRDYFRWLLTNYSFNNKFLVLDCDISRKYEELVEMLSPKGWEFFVIQLLVDSEVAKERVEKREIDFKGFFDDIDERIAVYEKFNKKYNAHIVLENHGEIDFSQLNEKLDLFLSKK